MKCMLFKIAVVVVIMFGTQFVQATPSKVTVNGIEYNATTGDVAGVAVHGQAYDPNRMVMVGTTWDLDAEWDAYTAAGSSIRWIWATVKSSGDAGNPAPGPATAAETAGYFGDFNLFTGSNIDSASNGSVCHFLFDSPVTAGSSVNFVILRRITSGVNNLTVEALDANGDVISGESVDLVQVDDRYYEAWNGTDAGMQLYNVDSLDPWTTSIALSGNTYTGGVEAFAVQFTAGTQVHGIHVATGADWLQDVIAILPKYAMNPVPEDGNENVRDSQVLSWSAPPVSSGDTLTYEVYLDTDPNLLVSGIDVGTATSYAPSLMKGNTYYWRVDVTDPNFGVPAVIPGSVWSFTVPDTPAAMLVSPDNGEMDLLLDVMLDWTSDSQSLTHELYLRISGEEWPGTPTATINAPGDTDYTPSGLVWDTTYEWRVDETYSGSITVTGDTWSFSTATPVCNGGVRLPGDEDGDCVVDLNDLAMTAANWLVCGMIPVEACP